MFFLLLLFLCLNALHRQTADISVVPVWIHLRNLTYFSICESSLDYFARPD